MLGFLDTLSSCVASNTGHPPITAQLCQGKNIPAQKCVQPVEFVDRSCLLIIPFYCYVLLILLDKIYLLKEGICFRKKKKKCPTAPAASSPLKDGGLTHSPDYEKGSGET